MSAGGIGVGRLGARSLSNVRLRDLYQMYVRLRARVGCVFCLCIKYLFEVGIMRFIGAWQRCSVFTACGNRLKVRYSLDTRGSKTSIHRRGSLVDNTGL